jgi:hypothetical protein
VINYHLAPVDAQMTRLIWNELPAEAVVFDVHEWRAVPVTGRPTRSFADNTTPLEVWQELRAAPYPIDIATAGYDFIYMDEAHWSRLDLVVLEAYSDSCVVRIAEAIDNEGQFFRHIYDVRECRP